MKKLFILPFLVFFLTGFTSKPNTLDQIAEENKGKVILIDFWASWCKPCREEMKKMPKFKKSFEGKNIVYVYVSLDIDEAKWKQAIEEEGISNAYNFIRSQVKGSKILKGQIVQAIPRYMIINKQGELINNNAPRPGKELRKELEKYLAE